MAIVGFSNIGYEYFDESKHFLFSEDNAHTLLFNYITKDLSSLPKLFEQYISKRMNTTNFELYHVQNRDNEICEIKKILSSAHTYYEKEYEKTIIKTIGNYFNELLLWRRNFINNLEMDEETKQKWYNEKITALFPEFLSSYTISNELDPISFYLKYKQRVGEPPYDSSKYEEVLIFKMPKEEPRGFTNEITTQTEIANMLYFILDIDAPHIDKLTTHQRIWLCGNITNPEIHVKKQLSLCQPPRLYSGDRSADAENSVKLNDMFSTLNSLYKRNIVRDGIPDNLQEHYTTAIQYAKKITSTQIYEEYEINNLYQLLFLEIIFMIQNKTLIRKCRNCGKYFVASNRKITYCNQMDDSGQCCSDVGPKRTFQKKMADEEALKVYTRAYKTHFARSKKGTMTPEELHNWRDEAKEKLEEVRSGKIDLPTFQSWLKK